MTQINGFDCKTVSSLFRADDVIHNADDATHDADDATHDADDATHDADDATHDADDATHDATLYNCPTLAMDMSGSARKYSFDRNTKHKALIRLANL